MMTVDFAFLCESALVTGGVLSALGIGFPQLTTERTPYQHPQLVYVTQIRATTLDAGSHTFLVRLVDADGKTVNELSTPVAVPQPAPGHDETFVRTMLPFRGLVFPQFGAYAFHFVVDGDDLHRVPLQVRAPLL